MAEIDKAIETELETPETEEVDIELEETTEDGPVKLDDAMYEQRLLQESCGRYV